MNHNYLTNRDPGDETPADQPCPCGEAGFCIRQPPWNQATTYPVCPELPVAESESGSLQG